MSYGEAKVYFDGSHYIAIPHTTNPSRKRRKPAEKVIVVDEETNEIIKESTPSNNEGVPFSNLEEIDIDFPEEIEEQLKNEKPIKAKKTRAVTHKELFEEFYKESQKLSKWQRKNFIVQKMKPYFDDEEKVKLYVEENIARKKRNLITRRIRMMRKANLQEFNYFCTFTYDDAKHTEESFQKDLKICLNNFSSRKKWKYIGVWERSPEKNRLHFHGIFYIPDTSCLGMYIERRDYSFAKRDIITTYTFSYFENRFGRADFELLNDKTHIGSALAYLIKYIEKTGGKIIYSKGLPQYFISDIMDDDIVCPFGVEDKKLLLFDDFSLWDEGCYMGTVCPENIEMMRKSN